MQLQHQHVRRRLEDVCRVTQPPCTMPAQQLAMHTAAQRHPQAACSRHLYMHKLCRTLLPSMVHSSQMPLICFCFGGWRLVVRAIADVTYSPPPRANTNTHYLIVMYGLPFCGWRLLVHTPSLQWLLAHTGCCPQSRAGNPGSPQPSDAGCRAERTTIIQHLSNKLCGTSQHVVKPTKLA